MGEDLGEKTEPATDRRREQTRQRGQVAKSQDLSGAFILLAGIVSLHIFGPIIGGNMKEIMAYCLSEAWMDLNLRIASDKLAGLVFQTFFKMTPWIVVVVFAANAAFVSA